MFSVCAVVSFNSCIATTSDCVVRMRYLSSSTVLLMPFALSVRVWGAGVATYGSLCDGDMWGESGRVGCIRYRV